MRYICILAITISLWVPVKATAQDIKSVQAWYDTMEAAGAYMYQVKRQEGLALFQKALTMAPSAEHEADTLLYLAEAYEAVPDREAAIRTYMRIADGYPSSRHVSHACHRLGELYSSVTLLPSRLSEEEMLAGMKDMRPERALVWFERSLMRSEDSWTRGSKRQIATLYVLLLDRREEGMALLRELAEMDVRSIASPDYRGPYLEMNAPEETIGERLDRAREEALSLRSSSRGMLVEWSVVNDPEQSIKNLKALIERYPDSDISGQASAQIAAIAAEEKSVQAISRREAVRHNEQTGIDGAK